MSTVKELLESGDTIIIELTEQFLNEEISWDEFYDLVRARLKETGKDAAYRGKDTRGYKAWKKKYGL